MATAWRGIVSVAGAFLIQITLGILGSDGNMVPYMISYVHERIDSKAGMYYTAFVGTLHTASYALLVVPSGYLANRIGYRATIAIASIVFCAGMALTCITIRMNFIMVLLTYAFLNGLGASMGYGNTVACGMKWFPDNHGLSSGFIVAGFGLGAFVFDPLQSLLVNPDNVSPTKDGYFVDASMLDRIPNALLYLAAVYFVVQMVGCAMLCPPPKTIQRMDSSTTDMTPLQMLRTKEFYVLWLIMFCNSCVMSFFNAMYKAYGQSFILDDHYLAFVGSVMSVLNAVGRFSWGYLLDRYTFTPCIQAVTTGITVLMFTIPATKAIGSKAVFTMWSAAVFFFTSGTFSLTPAIMASVFGTRHMAANYGLLFASTTASAISMAILSAFLDHIGYTLMFHILGGVNAFGLVLTFVFEHMLQSRETEKSKNQNSANGKSVWPTENGVK